MGERACHSPQIISRIVGPRRLRGVTCPPVPVPGTARGHVRLRTARVAPWTRGRRRLQTGRRVVPPSWGARPTPRTRQTWEEPPVHARRRPTWTLGFRGHLALGATQPERGQKRIPAPGSSRPCGDRWAWGTERAEARCPAHASEPSREGRAAGRGGPVGMGSPRLGSIPCHRPPRRRPGVTPGTAPGPSSCLGGQSRKWQLPPRNSCRLVDPESPAQ